MKRSRLFLGFVVAISLIAAPSFAAVKTGAKCSKVGKTATVSGKKFTCIKSGKKLVWNKGVAIKKPTPVATPTPIAVPAPTPTPTAVPKPTAVPTPTQSVAPLTDSEIAYNSLVSIYNAAPIPTYELKKVVHPSVTQATADRILARYQKVVKFWRDEFAVRKISIIVGNNDQVLWIKEQLELATKYKYEDWYKNHSAGLPEGRCNNYRAGSYGADKDGYFLQTFTLYPADCVTEEPQDANYRTTIEHELTHAAQSAVTENRIQLFPCWFKEGQASYYASVLGNTDSYEEMRASLKFQTRFISDVDPRVRLKLLDEKYNNFKCGQDGGFALGALAVQQLVIKYSHQKILDFMLKTNSIRSWRPAFEVTFGQSFEEFVDNLEDQALVTSR